MRFVATAAISADITDFAGFDNFTTTFILTGIAHLIDCLILSVMKEVVKVEKERTPRGLASRSRRELVYVG